MMNANTASTIQIRIEMMTRNAVLARGLTTDPAICPIDPPRWRRLMTSAEKSCTAPMKIVPTTTQISAGNHPQITAMAGPTIGAAPAIDVKWCPQSTAFDVGTKSIPSSNSRAGTSSPASSRKTLRARKPE